MPKFERIPAGGDPTPVTAEELEAAFEEAAAEVERLRLIRVAARGDDVTKAEKRQILADTDDEFTAAVEAAFEAEKALIRATRGDTEGQTVSVGVAKEVSRG